MTYIAVGALNSTHSLNVANV